MKRNTVLVQKHFLDLHCHMISSVIKRLSRTKVQIVFAFAVVAPVLLPLIADRNPIPKTGESGGQVLAAFDSRLQWRHCSMINVITRVLRFQPRHHSP
ncbi:hypothetical protein CROQUDRAFT_94806 [Cronartium quercuum f. sp. fusiforme G11]|uniref:Uncharacterized protein n=1 Tax=Cronartium quercuum f. sp. fusiforme G11 TaxID=708437 RepID=A0A9P6NEV9_9BASI|nr:hypothetical protein CROQUDRAFT_94806 [Cronartium quercuum f. sp. fusiforme G11]